MQILVLAPDPIVFGPPKPCADVYCAFPEDIAEPSEELEKFMLRHRYLGSRDILVVDDD